MKNNSPHQLNRRRLLFLLTGAGMLTMVVALIILIETRPAIAPDPFHTFDPATYGIPEIVAGYRVLSVQTLENTACIPAGHMRLTVQAVEPRPDNPMAASGDGNIRDELDKLNLDGKWHLQFVMPVPYDRERFIISNAEWNEVMKNGCIKLGGPAIIVTPTAPG